MRPRRPSPRCGPPQCLARCSLPTGRRGRPGGSGYAGRTRGPGRRGGPGATGCAPRGPGPRGRGTAMTRRGSGESTPGGCISWAAWSASWLQRTRRGAGGATVATSRCGHGTPRRPRSGGGGRGSARCGTGHTLLPRARPRIVLSPFFYLPFTLSLSLYREDGSNSSRGIFRRDSADSGLLRSDGLLRLRQQNGLLRSTVHLE